MLELYIELIGLLICVILTIGIPINCYLLLRHNSKLAKLVGNVQGDSEFTPPSRIGNAAILLFYALIIGTGCAGAASRYGVFHDIYLVGLTGGK